MGFFRQENWSRLPFPSSEDFPDPEIKPMSPALQADSLPTEPPGKPLRFRAANLKNKKSSSSQTQKAAYRIIPFKQYSGKGKTTGVELLR